MTPFFLTFIGNEAPLGRPTCVTFFNSRPDPTNATQCLVGTSTGWLALIDVETGKVVNKASPATESPSGGPAPDTEFGTDPFTAQTAPIDTSKLPSFTYSCLSLISEFLFLQGYI